MVRIISKRKHVKVIDFAQCVESNRLVPQKIV